MQLLFEFWKRSQDVVDLRYEFDINIDSCGSPTEKHCCGAPYKVNSRARSPRAANCFHELPKYFSVYFFTHASARSKLTNLLMNELYLEWAEFCSIVANRS